MISARTVDAGIEQRAPARLTDLLERLEVHETRIVRACVAHARRHRLTRFARMVTAAGNGWLYPIVAAIVLASPLQAAAHAIVRAVAGLGIAFIVYPPLKRSLARKRPCDLDPSLRSAVVPMDVHSFPSGHAMTAATFGLPFVLASPMICGPVVLAGWAVVSWSRIALGHHFPSDIAFGTLLGAAVVVTVSMWIL